MYLHNSKNCSLQFVVYGVAKIALRNTLLFLKEARRGGVCISKILWRLIKSKLVEMYQFCNPSFAKKKVIPIPCVPVA